MNEFFEIKKGNTDVVTLLKAPVTNASERSCALQGENYLSLSFVHSQRVVLPALSWIEFEQFKFYLLEDYYPERKHDAHYSYELKFYGWEHRLAQRIFVRKVDLSTTDTTETTQKTQWIEPEFSLNGNLNIFGDLLCKCINDCNLDYKVMLPSNNNYTETAFNSLNFSGVTIWDALNQVCNAFGVEWWFSYNLNTAYLHLQRCELGDYENVSTIPSGHSTIGSGGLLKYSFANRNTHIPSLLYVYGSERNINRNDLNVSYAKRLCLNKTEYPNSCMTIESVGGEREEVKIFEEIYPSNTFVISEVESVNKQDDFDVFYVKIRDSDSDTLESIPDIEKLKFPESNIRMLFTKGKLSGREFDVKYHYDAVKGKRFEIIHEKLNDDVVIPSGSFAPEKDNECILVNINMPEEYIFKAQKALEKAATDYVEKLKASLPEVTCESDPVWWREKEMYLGKKICLNSEELIGYTGDNNQYMQSRVSRYSYKLNKPHNITFELSSALVGGKLAQMEQKISEQASLIDGVYQQSAAVSRRQWRSAEELTTMYDNLRSDMLLIGNAEAQFAVTCRFVVNYKGNCNSFQVSKGELKHLNYKNGDNDTWLISESVLTATDSEQPYYVYACCARNNNAGKIELSLNKMGVEEKDGYYYFNIGVLSSVCEGMRVFTTNYGFTQITGNSIKTGVIQSQGGGGDGLKIDIDSGTIEGKVTFKTGSSGLNNFDEWSKNQAQIKAAQDTAASAETKINNLAIGKVNYVRYKNQSFSVKEGKGQIILTTAGYDTSIFKNKTLVAKVHQPINKFSKIILVAYYTDESVQYGTDTTDLNSPLTITTYNQEIDRISIVIDTTTTDESKVLPIKATLEIGTKASDDWYANYLDEQESAAIPKGNLLTNEEYKISSYDLTHEYLYKDNTPCIKVNASELSNKNIIRFYTNYIGTEYFDRDFTFSFYVENNGDNRLELRPEINDAFKGNVTILPGSKERVVLTTKPTLYVNSVGLGLFCDISFISLSVDCDISMWQLELGNKPTEYKLSDYDVDMRKLANENLLQNGGDFIDTHNWILNGASKYGMNIQENSLHCQSEGVCQPWTFLSNRTKLNKLLRRDIWYILRFRFLSVENTEKKITVELSNDVGTNCQFISSFDPSSENQTFKFKIENIDLNHPDDIFLRFSQLGVASPNGIWFSISNVILAEGSELPSAFLRNHKEMDYLKSAIRDGNTSINGGLLLSNLMAVTRPGTNIIQSGMSGVNDGVSFFADDSDVDAYAMAVNYVNGSSTDKPKFLVTEEGKLYAVEGVIGVFDMMKKENGNYQMVAHSAENNDIVIDPEEQLTEIVKLLDVYFNPITFSNQFQTILDATSFAPYTFSDGLLNKSFNLYSSVKYSNLITVNIDIQSKIQLFEYDINNIISFIQNNMKEDAYMIIYNDIETNLNQTVSLKASIDPFSQIGLFDKIFFKETIVNRPYPDIDRLYLYEIELLAHTLYNPPHNLSLNKNINFTQNDNIIQIKMTDWLILYQDKSLEFTDDNEIYGEIKFTPSGVSVNTNTKILQQDDLAQIKPSINKVAINKNQPNMRISSNGFLVSNDSLNYFYTRVNKNKKCELGFSGVISKESNIPYLIAGGEVDKDGKLDPNNWIGEKATVVPISSGKYRISHGLPKTKYMMQVSANSGEICMVGYQKFDNYADVWIAKDSTYSAIPTSFMIYGIE